MLHSFAKEHLLKCSLKLRSGLWDEGVLQRVSVWFGLRLLIWSWHYGVKLVFSFFFSSPPLPRKLLPPSGTGLWKAGQVSPTRMAWKHTRIYQAALLVSPKSGADCLLREQGLANWTEYRGLWWDNVATGKTLRSVEDFFFCALDSQRSRIMQNQLYHCFQQQ